MSYSPMLTLHICGGTLGLLSGAAVRGCCPGLLPWRSARALAGM